MALALVRSISRIISFLFLFASSNAVWVFVSSEEDEDDESKQPKKSKRKRTKAEVLAKGCITAISDMDPALLQLEAGGGDMTLNQRTQMKKGSAVFDLYAFISDIKENWEIEK